MEEQNFDSQEFKQEQQADETMNNETAVPNDAEENLPKEEKEKKKSKGFFDKKDSKVDKLKEQIETLTIEKQELNDKFLRLYSEFDNYKKRTNKEKLDLLSTASEKVIVNLLPVVDDFERAIKANESVEDIQVLKDGFDLIYNKLLQLLKRFDVEEIDALGLPFDTDFHEAITHFQAPTEEEKGMVMAVTEKGYKIKDKVVRFAKVVVAN
ncbi:MAG: nucleotide exchange factor GrpE [Bacteroidales bacterium]|jgi:molecular chaperone GrpE|nr:nucleotide exchange factor GrpE [Bacteroidales bacterium]